MYRRVLLTAGLSSALDYFSRQIHWDHLQQSLAGLLILPGDWKYNSARKLYNARYDGSFPSAIAICKNAYDIRECIAFAQRNRIPIHLRSGGHSYAGWSTGPGLVIDLSGMNSVLFDHGSERATIQAGAILIDINNTLAAAGRFLPVGSCPTVGISGLTLGGGVSMFSRAYGLTCDNLEELDIVDASGQLITCNKNHNSDLFWASRGGGGGNFGVATRFVFRTHPACNITRLMLEWPWNSAADVMRSWQRWAPTMPDELWSYCQYRSNPTGTEPRVRSLNVYLGDPADLDRILQPFVHAVPATPIQTLDSSDSLSAMQALAGCQTISLAQCHLMLHRNDGALPQESFSAKSAFFSRPLTDGAIEAIKRYIEQAHVLPNLLHGGITFDAFGGAINRVPWNATAFCHRNALFNSQLLAYWANEASPATQSNCLAWLSEFHREIARHSNGGAYVNYTDPELQRWQTAYYGRNSAKLARLKEKYDPNRLFSFPQALRLSH